MKLNEMIDKLDVTVSNDSVDIRSSPFMSDLIKPRKKNQNQSVLKYCYLIQVVSIKDGYAKISRKKGFVKVNKSNIVISTCFLFCLPITRLKIFKDKSFLIVYK